MKNLHNTLETITQNKIEIKSLIDTNTKLISEVLPLINQLITSKREENDTYKQAKKATLAKLIKVELDSKESVINTALNLVILGLNVDNTLSLSKINQIITLFNKKVLTKSYINKSDKEKLTKKLSEINKAHKIELATKLINA